MNYKIVSYVEAIALIILIVAFRYFSNNHNGTVALSGAGATFPAPLVQKWTEEFYILTGAQIDYEGIGSGGGIKQHVDKSIDFGASDTPMKKAEFESAPSTLHIPITIGGIAIIYNLEGAIKTNLKFTGETLADIFSQKITKWNDPKIVQINPGIALPDKDIVVCHRADSSGTTNIYTNFLSDESQLWKENYGTGNIINWPKNTLGSKGNPGVAQLVQINKHSIGYVELSYATENKIQCGEIKNAKGEFIGPSISSIAIAANASSVTLPKENKNWDLVGNYFNLHKVEDPGMGYPISNFSYLMVYKDTKAIPSMTEEKTKALVKFLWYITHSGQYYAPGLSYVPLLRKIIEFDEKNIKSITFNGKKFIDWL